MEGYIYLGSQLIFFKVTELSPADCTERAARFINTLRINRLIIIDCISCLGITGFMLNLLIKLNILYVLRRRRTSKLNKLDKSI